ncbi:polyprotein [Phytophthora megakarya]|uniref:Polyprotein n=1 Tax=Phytophthora megakarya TaxID=4795 RepID=A0A225W3A5_9STRA|nr:polyprotein [Phytophthora megakarya]
MKFEAQEDLIIGNLDAERTNDVTDRRSISGAIWLSYYWPSKKQTLVTKSSTSAEYVAADLAAEEAMRVKHLLNVILGKANAPNVAFYLDNKSTIQRIKNGKSY